LLTNANERGIGADRIWFDPIATPAVNINSNHVKPCLEFLAMLPEIARKPNQSSVYPTFPTARPNHLRPYLNRTFLMMLMKYNIYSVILDALDRELIDIARGKRPELVQLVQRTMDGGKIDLTFTWRRRD